MTDLSQPTDNVERPIQITLFGKTDVGQIREHNEDNFVVADLSTQTRLSSTENHQANITGRGILLGVCDGMGGAAAGEVASKLAVELIFSSLTEASFASSDDLALALVQAVEAAGKKIYQEARSDRSRRGMGTTSTIAAVLGERLFIGQVGDSRGYILRQDRLVQVTRDQSLVNQLIEAGQLTLEEAETFEHNNIILQALGTAETVQVDLTSVDLRRDDVLMLCSDGLSGMVKDAEIKSVLSSVSDPRDACEELIARANAAGGHDNITVVVARFSGEGLPPPTAEDERLAYKKFPLPPRSEATAPAPRVAPTLETVTTKPPQADGDSLETQPLKVGLTILESNDEIDRARAAARARINSAPPKPKSTSGRPPSPTLATVDLTPRWVGLIVLGALLLIAGMGFALLR
jgi:serine/threonine protein phosphatase PrpC